MVYLPVPKGDIKVGEEKFSCSSLKDRLKAAMRLKLNVTVATALISLSAILIFVLLYIIISHQPSPIMIETCGISPAEAERLGCVFNTIEFAWLLPCCFDKDLQEEFTSLRDWQWYLNKEGTQDADEAKVLEGAYDELYATQEYHVFNCDIYYTVHCEMQITKFRDYDWNDTSTTVYTKYADCPREQKDIGRMGWYRIIGGKKVHRNP